MQKSAFLARVVSAAILSGAMFGASPVSACDTYYGACDTAAPWEWDYEDDCANGSCDTYEMPDDSGDDSDGGDNGSNYIAAGCLNLIQIGLPSSCTLQPPETVAGRNLFIDYLGLDVLMSSYVRLMRENHPATHPTPRQS